MHRQRSEREELGGQRREFACGWKRRWIGRSGRRWRSHAEVHLAGEIFPGVAEAPGFDPEVVHVNDDGNDEA